MTRQLSTASAVLQALRLVQEHDGGITAAELGTSLGRSAATARYLLNSLQAEGFAERGPQGRWRAPGAVVGNPYSRAVAELHRRTRRGAAAWRADGRDVEVLASSTHQGLPALVCPDLEGCGLVDATRGLRPGEVLVHEHGARLVVARGARVPGTAVGVVTTPRRWRDDREGLLAVLAEVVSGPDADAHGWAVARGAHAGPG